MKNEKLTLDLPPELLEAIEKKQRERRKRKRI